MPFVEGKLEGHKERKNYSILGPGVAEDANQSIKISEPHGFNLGAVSAKPLNGSGLHSHLTAEVFIIYSGKWRFYWGSKGKDETILNAAITMTNIKIINITLFSLFIARKSD